MVLKLLCLCLLLNLPGPSWANEQTCFISDSSCSKCIQADPQCAWCTDTESRIHCHTLEGLQKAGCDESHIYHPQGAVQIVRNDSRTEPAEAKTIFLQPQELKLSLRPGVSQSFLLTVTPADDQPVSELTLDTSPVPAGVNITFKSITSGTPLIIQVNVEAVRCLKDGDQTQNSTGPWSVQITPRGFSLSLELQLTLECQCDCMKDRVENSPVCSGNGALVCGKCRCNEPYIGNKCQRTFDSIFLDEESCRSGPKAPVCSNRGDCIFGECECRRLLNPAERYSGQFCQCANFDCPRAINRLCGGHGRCECGQCVCDDGWTGEACSCSMETASCMAANGQLCNGRGTCECGRCRCESPYAGPTCESCPVCPGVCQQHADCVECRAFGTGRNKDSCHRCGYFTMTMVDTKTDLPQDGDTPFSMCKMRGQDDCMFYYVYATLPSMGQAVVVRAKECSAGLGK